MMLYLRCFSGTGNSLNAATWISDEAGGTAKIEMIGNEAPHEAPGNAIQGIVFPTHGFTAPWVVLRYVLRMPKGKGRRIFLAATRGMSAIGSLYIIGAECNANIILALILRCKGYRVIGMTGIDMPHNFISVFWSLNAKHAEHVYQRSERQARQLARALLDGKKRNLTFANAAMGIVGIALIPGSLVYLLIGRMLLAKILFANGKCTGCGLCGKSCPVNGIRMTGGRPYWKFSCEHCMRCINICPVRAIEASHQLLALYIALCFAPWGAVAAAALNPAILNFLFFNPAVTALAAWALIITGAFVLYGLFWLLCFIPPVRAFFTWTTLTHYYRRYRAPGMTVAGLQRGTIYRDQLP